MPVVTNTIKRPDGTAYTSGRVVIELAGENGRPLSGGYVTASDYTIESAFTIESLSSGVWSQTLVANSLISPSGTVWRVTEQVDGRNHVYYVSVPDGAGPYFVEDILSDAPSAIASAPLTAHLADALAAHAASAVSFAPAGTIAATDLQAAVVEVASGRTAINVATEYGVSTAASAAQNSLNFASAIADAKADGRRLYLPGDLSGYYELDDDLTFDYGGELLVGDGGAASRIKFTGLTHGCRIEPSTIIYRPTIRGIGFYGPSSGSGIGVWAAGDPVKNGMTLDHVRISDFGGDYLYTRFIDYLILISLRASGSSGGHRWVAGNATNAAVMIGGAFTGAYGAAPAGKAGLKADDLDSATFIGVEFGQLDYAVLEDAGESQNVSFYDCRAETIGVRHVQIGVGSAASYTSGWRWIGGTLHNDTGISPLVDINGAQKVKFEGVVGSQMTSGQVLIKSTASTAINKSIKAIDCIVGSGVHILEGAGSPGTYYDKNVNVVSGDASDVSPLPYSIQSKVGALAVAGGAQTINLGMSPRTNITVKSVALLTATAIPADASNYWTFTVLRYSAGASQGTTATRTTAAGTWATARRGQTVTLGAQVTLSALDAFVLVATPTGTPPDLTEVSVMITYEPQSD